MFRTVTSDVAAVSSFVANSTSPCNTFLPPSPKTPYGGFSPVRLQTGIQPRLSPVSIGLSTRCACTRPSPPYTWPKLLAQKRVFPQLRWLVRRRALCSSSTPFNFANNTPVQWPLACQRVGSPTRWLANGLCCLIRSSLTMASSETLDPSHRFMSHYDRPLPYDLVWTGIERLPNLLHVSFPSAPLSVPRWTERLLTTVSSPSVLAFAFFVQARHP